ncbi:MAG: c-type cytochrome [Opitutales bacterium]
MRIFLSLFVFIILAVVSILGFRGTRSDKPPLEIFPDMDRQARYKPQAENSFFEDGRNDRPVPAKTVQRGAALNYGEVFSSDFDDSERRDPGYREGKNPDGSEYEGFPIKVDNQLIEHGREKYGIFCASCHGPAGDGNGVTKDYDMIAASYHDDRLREATNGYLFDVIMNGKGLMYGLKGRLDPKEAWAVVLYVRALQRSQHAGPEDLSAQQRKELDI